MLRKFIAFSFLLLLICAAFSAGVVSAAGGAHLPILLFSTYHYGDDSNGDLYLYDLHHRATLRLSSPVPPNPENNAVMSPDGSYIALTLGSGAAGILGLMQLDEQWQLRNDMAALLMRNQLDVWYPPAWSPRVDGNVAQLAFATNVDPEVDSSEWRDTDIWVFEVPLRRWQDEDFHPSGNEIIPAFGATVLQSARRLTRDDSNEYGIAWSPDGSQMAFVSDRDRNYEIYVLDTSGVNQNIRRITNDLAPDLSPTWSPDSQWLAFASERHGNSEIYVVSANGGEPRRLTDNAARNIQPAWSPDGAYIAYLADGIITLIHPDGSAAQPLFPGWDVSWLP